MDEETSTEDVPWRWPTAAAVERINSLLNIDADQYGQDWEFEISDSRRLPEYLDIYENKLKNEDERFALMSVIIDAFEAYGPDDGMWGRIRNHLRSEFLLHKYTIHYWCYMDEDDSNNWWRITFLMRELWDECMTF